MRFIAREARVPKAGGETVITRLADILVVQMIRSWIDHIPDDGRGWIAAIRDENVGRALRAIHAEPGRDWTVATLAKQACLSRSAFSSRFTELVGEPAMQYLTQWRMQVAHTWLEDSADPISSIARRSGYRSEAAFGRAFKRVMGVSPGSIRR